MVKEQVEIMRNILYAVETGGQEYGKRDYSDFTEAYTNSPTEYAITIGAGAFYGVEAQRLLKDIYKASPSAWEADDSVGLLADVFNADWNCYCLTAVSQKAKLIKKIIGSHLGIIVQDTMMDEIISEYEREVLQMGVTDTQAVCMCINFVHQGGIGSVKRILEKTEKPVCLKTLYAACKTDTGNQVGTYKSRQQMVYESINQYIPKEVIFMDYINDRSTHWISNSGSDENGSYAGGQAGDQTGGEWRMRSWYDRKSWSCVLRHPNPKIGLLLADLAIKAALNDKIGYDQNQRDTYWSQLQKVGYDPAKITTACESDCSAGVIANTKAAGYLLDLPELRMIGATYTGNMRNAYRSAGFIVLTESKYLTGPEYLLPGDILLNDEHHTCTNVTRGSKVVESEEQEREYREIKLFAPVLKEGMHGTDVKILQMLIGGIDADGDFGPKTAAAVLNYKKAHGLISTTSNVGANVWRELSKK